MPLPKVPPGRLVPSPSVKALDQRPRVVGLAVALLAAGTVVAACGGGSATPRVASLGSKSTTATTGPVGNSGQAQTGLLRYANCMQTHGEPDYPSVPYDDPDALAKVDQNTPQYQAADKACRKYLVASPLPSSAERAAVEAKALKFAHCMQTHGMPNWPDPLPNGGGFAAALAGPGAKSPAYQRAIKTCKPLFP